MAQIKCLICESSEIVTIYNNEGYPVWRCANCKGYFLHPQPDFTILKKEYNNENIFSETVVSSWLKHSNKDLDQLWSQRVRKIESFVNCGRILDIGCGTGDFVKKAKEKKWDIYATEFSPQLAQFTRDKYNIPVFIGPLKDANYPNEYFDVVTLWHVLEHYSAINIELQEINRILKKNGLIIIEVPNVDFIFKKSYRIPISTQLHLFHFNKQSLVFLLKNNGFSVLEIECTNTGFFREKPIRFLLKKIIDMISKVNKNLYINQSILTIARRIADY